MIPKHAETCLHIGRNSICIRKKYALELSVAATHPMQHALAGLLMGKIQENTHSNSVVYEYPPTDTLNNDKTHNTGEKQYIFGACANPAHLTIIRNDL